MNTSIVELVGYAGEMAEAIKEAVVKFRFKNLKVGRESGILLFIHKKSMFGVQGNYFWNGRIAQFRVTGDMEKINDQYSPVSGEIKTSFPSDEVLSTSESENKDQQSPEDVKQESKTDENQKFSISDEKLIQQRSEILKALKVEESSSNWYEFNGKKLRFNKLLEELGKLSVKQKVGEQ